MNPTTDPVISALTEMLAGLRAIRAEVTALADDVSALALEQRLEAEMADVDFDELAVNDRD